jgi:predicted permease
VLARYRLAHSFGEAGLISVFSLVVHPALTLMLGQLMGIPLNSGRMAVLVAAMAPGINSYLFAQMYQRGQGVAANTVLLGSLLSVLSISLWLLVIK